jgi:hypothetical protein
MSLGEMKDDLHAAELQSFLMQFDCLQPLARRLQAATLNASPARHLRAADDGCTAVWHEVLPLNL